MSARTFLALEIDDAIRDLLLAAQDELGRCGVELRAVERANLHVTLVFLGDVGDEMLADVCNIAAQAAAEIEPFEFAVSGLVAVPPRGALRMVWAGVDDPTGRMTQLQAGLADGLGGLGLRQEERAFNAHITLARVRSRGPAGELRDGVARWADRDFGTHAAGEVVVFASRLTQDGPVYTPLARAPLGG